MYAAIGGLKFVQMHLFTRCRHIFVRLGHRSYAGPVLCALDVSVPTLQLQMNAYKLYIADIKSMAGQT